MFNVATVDHIRERIVHHHALTLLLIEKGIITHDEYDRAVVQARAQADQAVSIAMEKKKNESA